MGKRKAVADAQTPSKDKMDIDGEDEESDDVIERASNHRILTC